MAKLIFRYGAMNSGKSTILIQTDFNYKERGMNTLVMKPRIDTKGDNKIVSRIGASVEIDLFIDENYSLETIAKIIKEKNIHAILVDEAQFLSREVVEDLFYISKFLDIPVLCYGLRVDFQAKFFPGSLALFELADDLIEMPTICYCGKKARLIGRKVNGQLVFDGDQVVIDGTANVEYVSMCAKCYLKAKGGSKFEILNKFKSEILTSTKYEKMGSLKSKLPEGYKIKVLKRG